YGGLGVEGSRCLAEHFDEDGGASLDAMQHKPAVILGQAVDDDSVLGSGCGRFVKQLDVQLGLAHMHLGWGGVVVLRGAMRFHFKCCLRPVRPFDQSVGCAGEAEAGQHQSSLFGAGVMKAPSCVREAGGEIGRAPVLKSMATIEDAVGMMNLAN